MHQQRIYVPKVIPGGIIKNDNNTKSLAEVS